MATFLSTAVCPRVTMIVSSKNSFSNPKVSTFSGLKQIPRIQLSKANNVASSTKAKCFKHAISCSIAEAETLEIVQSTIAKQLSIDVTTVAPQTKFADLGADSLDTVEIMMALEEQFGVSIGEAGAENIATVQDAADLIEKVKEATA